MDFSKEYLSQSDVVNWLTRCLYPGDVNSNTRKRIRARIDYARKQGKLAKAKRTKGQLFIETNTFFEWAFANKGWEKLGEFKDIPRNVTISNVTISIEGLEAKASSGETDALAFPDAKDELIEDRKRLKAIEKELFILREEKEKRESRSRKARISGKKGGRPKKSG